MRRLALAPLVALMVFAPATGAAARGVYVANGFGALGTTVTPFDTITGTVGLPTTVGTGPFAVAIAPNGSRAYVANQNSDDVSVIETATGALVGPAIKVGSSPHGVAVSPDGSRVYVANEAVPGTVSVIDTRTNATTGAAITVGSAPIGLAATPDGSRVYVTSSLAVGTISVIDTAKGEVSGAPISVGAHPFGIAITPDGSRAYVTNSGAESVSVIDTKKNETVGAPIKVGVEPTGIAITPDGARAYVADAESQDVYVINTKTDETVGGPIKVGGGPVGIAAAPNGSKVYVGTGKAVLTIDVGTNQVTGSPIPIDLGTRGLAIVPDQPPIASFPEPGVGRPGAPLVFHGVGDDDPDPDGTNARYDWTFGDGTAAPNGGKDPSHTYRKPGAYKVTLTLTDDEGCSTRFVFTGQTASCNGSPVATQTQAIEVSYPAVRVRCPGRAGPRGCRFTLQAITKKHRGKAASALAKAKVKAGRPKVVAIRTKPAFASRLARVKKILLREKLTIHHSTKTRIVRLKVVR